MVLLSFILIVFTCSIAKRIISPLQDSMERKIGKAESAKEAACIRKQYGKYRIAIIIVFTFLIIPECFLFIRSSSNMSFGFQYHQILNVVLILPLITYSYFSLPVSSLTIEKFKEKINDKPFALFLRGFSTDDYTPPTLEAAIKIDEARSLKKQKQVDKNTIQFSERDFYWALKRFMPAYSVGMTKELDSPSGTKRIYLDDITWQNDVSYLIEKAQCVFILVNPSNNCLWEILECMSNAKDKTIFIIDNEDYVAEVKDCLKHKTPICFYKDITKHSMVYEINGKSIIEKYNNDYYGFRLVLKKYFNDKNKCHNTINLVDEKRNEVKGADDKRLGIDSLNLENNDEYEIAKNWISSSTLTEEQKTALSLQVFLVHFQKTDRIDWGSIPGLCDDENIL